MDRTIRQCKVGAMRMQAPEMKRIAGVRCLTGPEGVGPGRAVVISGVAAGLGVDLGGAQGLGGRAGEDAEEAWGRVWGGGSQAPCKVTSLPVTQSALGSCNSGASIRNSLRRTTNLAENRSHTNPKRQR